MNRIYPKNFSRAELIRSEAAARNGILNLPPNDTIESNIWNVAIFLQTLRDAIHRVYGVERRVRVNSCYRSPIVNRLIGGSKTSAHMYGLAADITVDDMTVYELARFIVVYMPIFDQVIVEFGAWVHIGIATKTRRRQQVLTAKKVNGRTVYYNGVVK